MLEGNYPSKTWISDKCTDRATGDGEGVRSSNEIMKFDEKDGILLVQFL